MIIKDIPVGFQFCIKWYGVIFPLTLVWWLIYALCKSAYIILCEDCILYHSWLFSEESQRIHYSQIKECVVNGGFWKHKEDWSDVVRGREIFLFAKGELLTSYEFNPHLILALFKELGEKRFGLLVIIIKNKD